MDRPGRRLRYTVGGSGKCLKKTPPITTLSQRDLQGPLHGILYIALALTKNTKETTVQTKLNISCAVKTKQTG